MELYKVGSIVNQSMIWILPYLIECVMMLMFLFFLHLIKSKYFVAVGKIENF